MTKRKRPAAELVEIPTPEGFKHFEWQVEDRNVKNRGVRGVRNLTQWPIDRYFKRNELSKDKKENRLMYEAAERFRMDFELSSLERRARQSFERREQSVEEMSNARLQARARFYSAWNELGPTFTDVYRVCCYGEIAGKDGLPVVRLGLKKLVKFYRF